MNQVLYRRQLLQAEASKIGNDLRRSKTAEKKRQIRQSLKKEMQIKDERDGDGPNCGVLSAELSVQQLDPENPSVDKSDDEDGKVKIIDANTTEEDRERIDTEEQLDLSDLERLKLMRRLKSVK